MIELQQAGELTPSAPARQYDEELDGLTAILIDACRALASAGHTRFIVRGFGQDPWPVDTFYDLAVVVEQVPDVIGALRRDEAATLGFWEQGIQRLLNFTPHGEDVTAECASMTDWRPAPEVIELPRQELLDMLERFLASFIDQVCQRCPDLAEHPWFRSWSSKHD
jgi:hypothetical protein